jgi:hypothetical protein
MLTGPDGRRARSAVAELSRKGLSVSAGPPPDGALILAGEDDAVALTAGVHLTVRASSSGELDEEDDTLATPVEAGRQQ